MEAQPQEPKTYQIFARLLNGKTRVLNFNSPKIQTLTLIHRIEALTLIPISQFLLVANSRLLRNDGTLNLTTIPTVHQLCRLRGGKGGFGSLLRGAATKAGAKKTQNFDACRDMSGRRLRHVNAAKRIEEWRKEEEGRELERKAEEFLKKKAKEVKKKSGGGGAEKYLEKYRVDSAKAMEEVERTVRESLRSVLKGKRKAGMVEGADGSKKLKIWMGKRKVDESDSDGEEDDDDSEEEMNEEFEKSVVTNNENSPDSYKEPEESSKSVTGGKVDGESSVGCSSESCSEEEEIVRDRKLDDFRAAGGDSLNVEGDKSDGPLLETQELSIVRSEDTDMTTVENETVQADTEKSNGSASGSVEERVGKVPSFSSVPKADSSEIEAAKVSDSGSIVDEKTGTTNCCGSDFEKPLNFDEFSSAAELEVLGMDRLKAELQARGLKCGGTLQERAARLFLLKTTPLEMLPKKLLAKK